ncbi:MAG: lamin tail domain-containing protein [Candidatus Pacebacteria bacterium]|jgi:hypothetical protein|nr:lamin tail domain-containing protein [Candidatus Paceibacterota bacterium]
MWLKLAIFSILLLPGTAFSQVVIGEIMYDLEGSDTDREWMEVFNESSSSVDLSGWRFFEGTSNHKLTLKQGGATLESGEYAVIVDDDVTFLIDWPNYSGALFDSSFSLSNTGETLILRDSELSDIDSVTYSSEWGGKGDGNSLTRDDGGNFSGALPTPGSGDLNSEEGSSEESSESSSSGAISATTPLFTPEIFAYAGEDRTVTVGADTKFEGQSIGLEGEPMTNARYLWNFGDGSIREGENVLHNFKYPGDYVVVLNVSSGQYSASDKIVVSALPAQLKVARGEDGSVILGNREDREIDLSWWYIKSGDKTFQLPEMTYILGSSEIRFSSSVTELSEIAELSLLYPNGSIALLESENEPQNQVPQQVVTEVVPKKRAEIPVIVPDIERVSEAEIKGEEQVAAPIAARESDDFYKWILALFGLIGLGVGAGLYIQKEGKDEFTIID